MGGYLIFALFWGLLVGLLAKRKNLSFWLWGGITTLSGLLLFLIGPILVLLVLAFKHYRCRQCKAPLTSAEVRKKTCRHCQALTAKVFD